MYSEIVALINAIKDSEKTLNDAKDALDNIGTLIDSGQNINHTVPRKVKENRRRSNKRARASRKRNR